MDISQDQLFALYGESQAVIALLKAKLARLEAENAALKAEKKEPPNAT